ncbi:uncharacterized protein BP01DRAFT_383231 [Aspergillus saccharolyticus JOP 1030-1]|uniref:Rhodopsin domain-containing protein n=1 Tax=Aspergillus saccharolyticus JOP 1030-1 TaxID=1450539 RepID=A0A318ZLI1_9EURO|nr:hypothetical protein BP01DRAFT_383231 [Aspergillus saccharolyticus JOP 1030-1]PYH44660.1 hypothetical protein BP01DRAFT_383231 [Aspergillus saccharolyticus JOP 1030-1]
MARPDVGQVVSWYIVTIVACFFLACRLWVRWRLLKRWYLDDLFVTVATLCLIGDLVIQHYMFNLGMSDAANMNAQEMINMMKMIIPGSTLYVTTLWLIKASLVIFYKRLADRTRYQTVYNITLGFLAATWLVLFFDIVFKCYPPSRQWKSVIDAELACPDKPSTINYWLTILFNIFTDVFIICLPISQVARLKMPQKQKWGVISVFLLGVLVVISSIIRAIYSHLNEQMIICTVSMIEASIAIIASCLPVLRTLVFGSHSRTGTYSGRRGYELSNSGYNTTGPTSKQRTTVSVTQTVHTPDDLSRHDSEDGLVKDTALGHGHAVLSLESGAGIAVTREYYVHEGEADGSSFR